MKRIALIAGWLISTALVVMYVKLSPTAQFKGGLVLAYFGFIILWYLMMSINIIKEWERLPVLFLGKWQDSYGPGFVFIDPLLHTILPAISVQDEVISIDAEKVQTQDNIRISIVGAITYRINSDKIKDAVVEVQDIKASIASRALTSLTDKTAETDLDHVLANRVKFSTEILEMLQERIKEWGVNVKAFEIKDFKISDSAIEQAIAMKAKAQKEGEAELKRANMQMAIVKALNAAAEELSADGWKFKGLETLIEMTRSAQNNTILIPAGLANLLNTDSQDAISDLVKERNKEKQKTKEDNGAAQENKENGKKDEENNEEKEKVKED